MFLLLLRRSVVPLISAVFLESVSDWKPLSHLEDDCLVSLSLSPDDSQMYLAAWIGLLCLHTLEVKARAVQAAGAGKMLAPIQKKLKGSWPEMFSSELQFQHKAE